MFSHHTTRFAHKIAQCSFAVAASLALGLAVAPGVQAQSDPVGNLQQVYVCKYVTNPNGEEALKAGKNPILVDAHSLSDGDIAVGASFSDAHSRSYVVALYEEDMVPPTIEDCPGDTVEQEVPVPAAPATTDLCNLATVTSNIAWVVPADSESVFWEVNEDGSITAYTTEGYVFTDATYEHTYMLPADNGIVCVTPPGGGSGSVLGAQTTTPQPVVQLEDTGSSTTVLTMLSMLIMAGAVLTASYGTSRSAKLLAIVRNHLMQPFVVPTV